MIKYQEILHNEATLNWMKLITEIKEDIKDAIISNWDGSKFIEKLEKVIY